MDRRKGARITDTLRQRIHAGPPDGYDQKLPRVDQLVVEFGVAKATMERVLRTLRAEGLIDMRRGSGIFIRRPVLYERRLVGDVFDQHDLAVAGEVDERGLFERMTGAAEDVEVDTQYARVPAPARVAALLMLDPGTLVLERTWVYTTDGRPYQIARSYMPVEVADAAGLVGPETERKGISTMWWLVQQGGYRLRLVHQRIEARMPNPVEAKTLRLGPGTPVIDLWGALYRDDGGAPLEAGVRVVPADQIAYVVDINLQERTTR